ncbi:MAG: sel1 repeat family protein [Defluviitaleaceae bacterium]|nr:sel1 repeat family protein [Defluviitaleaceae bacterium]
MDTQKKNLIESANQGDLESQFKLGRAYKYGEDGFGKDLLQGHKWLKLAAEGEHPEAQLTYAYFFIDIGNQAHIKHDLEEGTYWLKRAGENGNAQALWLLIGVYANFTPESSSESVVECFKTLIATCNDNVAAVELGAVYCGNPLNKHIRRFPGLKEYTDPKKGYRLMEEGIRLAEAEAENPLKYEQYAMICQAYDADTAKTYKPDLEDSRLYKGSDRIIALAKKMCYAEKALVALQNNNYSSPFPEDVLENLTANQRNVLESARGELLGVINEGMHKRV